MKGFWQVKLYIFRGKVWIPLDAIKLRLYKLKKNSMKKQLMNIKSLKEKIQELTTEEQVVIKGGIMVIIEDVVM